MQYSHATARKERDIYRCHVQWIQNWVQFEQHYSDCLSLSVVKNSPVNVIKVSAAILNLVSFSLFDRRDSDKPEKINILFLSGCWLWTLQGHKTLAVIRIEPELRRVYNVIIKKNSRCLRFRGLSFRGLRSEFLGSEFSWYPKGLAVDRQIVKKMICIWPGNYQMIVL